MNIQDIEGKAWVLATVLAVTAVTLRSEPIEIVIPRPCMVKVRLTKTECHGADKGHCRARDSRYVDPTGSNGNDGLSPATAWRTPLKVGISTFQLGDVILFKRDGVWNEWLTPPSSGGGGESDQV
jgi:hypothetical protein